MRTNEERIAAMHTRAYEMEKKKRIVKSRMIGGIACAASVVILAVLAVILPQVDTAAPMQGTVPGMNASLFSVNDGVSYLVIAVIAFLLGGAVTILCYRLKKWQDELTVFEPEKGKSS